MRFPDGPLGLNDRIDVAIAESFPASDPPSWNSGLERRLETIAEIIAATDLSVCSRNALDHAAALARAIGARLTVIHVREDTPRYKNLYRDVIPEPSEPPRYADLHVDTLDPGLTPPVDEEAATALAKTHDDQLEDLPLVRRVAVAGQPVEAILDTARLAGAGLIVVGSQGRGTLAGALLGSTADAVIRRSGLPVLAVPCAVPQRNDAPIVAVLDEPDSADEILRRASAIAAVLGCELVRLRVPNDGRVDRRSELASARLIVIAFEREETRAVNKSDPNVRVLLRSGLVPVLTIPVN